MLKKAAEYEVRRYSPYLVAETPMPRGSRPAAGSGFNDLASFIFGGNSRWVGQATLLARHPIERPPVVHACMLPISSIRDVCCLVHLIS